MCSATIHTFSDASDEGAVVTHACQNPESQGSAAEPVIIHWTPPGAGKSATIKRLLRRMMDEGQSAVFVDLCWWDEAHLVVEAKRSKSVFWRLRGSAPRNGTARPEIAPCRTLARSRSQSLIVRTLGLLQHKRDDVNRLRKSMAAGRANLIIQYRLFGTAQPPDSNELKLLGSILSAAVRRLAAMVIRRRARHCTTPKSDCRRTHAAERLREHQFESTHRTIARKQRVKTLPLLTNSTAAAYDTSATDPQRELHAEAHELVGYPMT
jgi:hypothetical protein